jgi:hypothetical protein
MICELLRKRQFKAKRSEILMMVNFKNAVFWDVRQSPMAEAWEGSSLNCFKLLCNNDELL